MNLRISPFVGQSVLVCMLLLGLTGCKSAAERSKRYMQRGDYFLAAERLSEAMIEYRNAVQQEPKSAEARYRLGRTYLAMGNVKSAVGEFSEALQLKPDYQEARLNLASAHLLRNDLDMAEPLIRATLAKEPNSAPAHAMQGQWFNAAGNKQAAAAEFEKAIALNRNNPDYYALLGTFHAESGRPELAEASLRRGVAANPKSSDALMMLGKYFVAVKRMREAEEQARLSMEADKKAIPPRLLLAQIQVLTGRLAEAEKTLRDVSAIDRDNPMAYRALAVFFETTGQREKAIEQYRAILKSKQLDTDVRYRLVETLLVTGKLDEAEKENRELLRTNTKSAQPQYNQGRIQMGRRQFPEAILSLQTAVSLESRAEVYYLLGNAQMATGLTKQARDSFSQALEINPKMIEATLAIAGLAISSGDRSGAIRLAETAAAAAPDSIEAMVTRARVLLATGDLKQGEAILQNALQKDSADVTALSLLLDLRISQGRAAEMPAKLAQLSKQQPNRPGLRWLTAVSYYATRDYQKAEAEVRDALKLDPQIRSAHRLLADVLLSRGDIQQAKTELRAAIVAEPASIGNYLALVSIYEAEGNWEEMKKLYTTARQYDPSSPVIANQLAYLLLEHGGDVDVALSLAQLAKEKLPASPHVADTMGLAYYRRGMYDLAVSQFKMATQIDDPSHHYHLGLGYAATKNPTAAAAAFQKALANPGFQQSPDGKAAREALAKLSK